MTLTPGEQRDIQVIGRVAVNALNALKRIHEMVLDPDDTTYGRVRSLALTTILDAEAQMEEIEG